MTRAEKVEQIRLLREKGLLHREVAERLGMKPGTVRNLINDPDGRKQRCRRERYRGKCVICGCGTDGSNGWAGAPRYCHQHANMNPDWLRKMTIWTPELIIERIQEWAHFYGEPPAIPDWNPGKARQMGDEARAERFESDDRWPWFTTVVRRFGSWNGALVAAGFDPRPAHGGGGNMSRRRASDPTHCAHGHPYVDENTYWWRGRRACRTCIRRRSREYQERRRAA